jgi:hypothetical protein
MPDLDFADVSWHNSIIAWNRFRTAGVRGGICKVSDGYFMSPSYRGHIDSQFKTNWQALDTFDLRGAYTFITFDANRSGGLSPAKQVKLAIDHIGDHKEKDIYAIDVEQHPELIKHISKQARLNMLVDAFAEARKWWDAEYIWNYTGAWWWDDQLPKSIPASILQHPLWMAYYGAERYFNANIPRGYTRGNVIAWQYKIGMIEGKKIDHNDFLWDWDGYLLPPIHDPVPEPPEDIEPIDPPPIIEPPPPEPIPDPIVPDIPLTPDPEPPKPKSWLERLIEFIIKIIAELRK